MFALNLLLSIIVSAFNVSNISTLGKNDDVIYDKQQISPKCAFNNDEYLSNVTNLTAYRYFSNTYSYSFQNYSSTGAYIGYFNLNSSNSGQGYWGGNVDLRSPSSTSFSTFVISTQNTGDTQLVINDTYESSSNERTYMLFRFFAPFTSPVSNIEFRIYNASGVDDVLYYGYYGFSGYNAQNPLEYAHVKYANNWFLLTENKNVSNNISNNPITNSTGGNKFCYYWFALFGNLNQPASFSIDVNYLGSFDRDYRDGYEIGYNDGYSNGIGVGYQNGYSTGYSEAENLDDTALTIFTGILEVGMLPVNVFLAIFNFEVFGINIAGIVSGLLTISVVIIILRFLLGGKTKDD